MFLPIGKVGVLLPDLGCPRFCSDNDHVSWLFLSHTFLSIPPLLLWRTISQVRWGMHLGFVRLRRWIENRRANRVRVWRAGVWAEAIAVSSALKIWRRHAQAQISIETSIRIAYDRNQTRRSCCSPLERHMFGVLKRHGRARNLERRVLRAWFAYAARQTQASKQVRRV